VKAEVKRAKRANRYRCANVGCSVQADTGRMLAQCASPAVVYVGVWTGISDSRVSGGTAKEANTSGFRAVFSFTGTGVSWIGARGPWAGIARVSVDGALVATIDTYASADQTQVAIYSTSGLASGAHTLTVEVTEPPTRSARAPGSSSTPSTSLRESDSHGTILWEGRLVSAACPPVSSRGESPMPRIVALGGGTGLPIVLEG